MRIKSRQISALQGDRLEYLLNLPLSEREWLVLVMNEQMRDEKDEAHKLYFAGHQLTLRCKLDQVGPLHLTKNEVNYVLFTLGGVAATATTQHDHDMQWRILRKLMDLHE